MAQTQVQPRSKIIKSGEVWNNGDDEKPKKYVTLQDIKLGYEDYVGLRGVCQFLVFAILLLWTLYCGISPASIKIKDELFEIMEARGDGPNTPLALKAQTYEEIQEVYTKIINNVHAMQINYIKFALFN